jgi:hypothetical protein
VRIRRWQPYQNPAGTMLGYLEMPSGMIVNDSKSERQLDRDGNPRTDANGQALYSQIVEFRDRVIEAIRQHDPGALEDGL